MIQYEELRNLYEKSEAEKELFMSNGFFSHIFTYLSKIIKYAGYTLSSITASFNPISNAVMYFGNSLKVPTTTQGTAKIYIPESGIITKAIFHSYSTVAGSNQDWSIYLRHNNTTDYLIKTVSSSNNERLFDNMSLEIPVTAGDYLEIKMLNPLWITPPTSVTFTGTVWIALDNVS